MLRRSPRGFTLVEMLVAVAITAILVGLATPSFRESIARSRLEGAVSTFAADLQLTRAEAVRAGSKRADSAAAASLIFEAPASYKVVTYSTAGGAGTTLKTVALPDGVTFTGLDKIQFDGLRGTAPAYTIQASSANTSAKLTLSTNALGRVALCSPSGSFSGYTAC